MSHLAKKGNVTLKRGTIIQGKWHKHRYVVGTVLGAGAIGTVYLCRRKNNGDYVALKISDQKLAMTTEVKVLQSLQKVQDTHLGPCLLDVDDWEAPNGKKYAYYVMEYIRGVDLRTFIRKHGSRYIGIFLLQMLEQLDKLHQAGWVFGDLKNDNIIVTLNPRTVRFVDVGGTTKMGRSIKEYTNFHDRAYWHLGKRVAEPSYDLFALVMVILAIYYPKTFQRTNHSRELIKRKMLQIAPLKPYYSCLLKAIDGKYRTAREMYDELLKEVFIEKKEKRRPVKTYMLETALLLIPTALFYVIYYLM